MIITDALTGKTATVDVENRLEVSAVSQDEAKHTNIEGNSNSLYFVVTPAGANDNFLFLQNTGSFDLSITDIRISSSVPTNILLDKVSGAPIYVSELPVQVTNRNLGQTKQPAIIANYDTDITGLIDEGVLLFQECDVANRLYHFKSASTIILPQGQAITLKRVEATGEITCLISLSKTVD
jgi:hypothetical protein